MRHHPRKPVRARGWVDGQDVGGVGSEGLVLTNTRCGLLASDRSTPPVRQPGAFCVSVLPMRQADISAARGSARAPPDIADTAEPYRSSARPNGQAGHFAGQPRREFRLDRVGFALWVWSRRSTLFFAERRLCGGQDVPTEPAT